MNIRVFPSLKLQGMAVSIMIKLWAGRYGLRISSGREIFSCPKLPDRLFGGMVTGFPFLWCSGRCLRLYTYLFLLRRLRMCGDIPPIPLHSFKARTRTALPFTYLRVFCRFLGTCNKIPSYFAHHIYQIP